MNQCIAFIADGRSHGAWRPCRRRAPHKRALCRLHEKMFAGIMLGIWTADRVDPRKDLCRHDLRNMPVASRKPS